MRHGRSYDRCYADQRGANSSWRGPTWLPINYLLVRSLEEHDPAFADELRERLVELVETDWERTGRFHEYFDAGRLSAVAPSPRLAPSLIRWGL